MGVGLSTISGTLTGYVAYDVSMLCRSTRDDLFSRSKVGPWYQRMVVVVGEPSRTNSSIQVSPESKATASAVAA